jgi:hypothetical protein
MCLGPCRADNHHPPLLRRNSVSIEHGVAPALIVKIIKWPLSVRCPAPPAIRLKEDFGVVSRRPPQRCRGQRPAASAAARLAPTVSSNPPVFPPHAQSSRIADSRGERYHKFGRYVVPARSELCSPSAERRIFRPARSSIEAAGLQPATVGSTGGLKVGGVSCADSETRERRCDSSAAFCGEAELVIGVLEPVACAR